MRWLRRLFGPSPEGGDAEQRIRAAMLVIADGLVVHAAHPNAGRGLDALALALKETAKPTVTRREVRDAFESAAAAMGGRSKSLKSQGK